MAITLTDNRTIIDEGDATTGWTSTNSLGVNNTSPLPIESTNRLEIQVSNAIQNAYFTLGSPVNMSAGHIIYFWISHRAEFDTTANIGVGIQIGDGTNRVAYGIMGSDNVAFAHFDGPVVWQCLTLDTGNLAAYPSTTIAGVAGNLNLNSITQIGLYFKTIVKSVGGAVNCFIDIGRYLDPSVNDGCAITITGGTSSTPGIFDEIASADRLTGNQQAHGIIRKLGDGLFGVQGPLRFGNPTGTASSWFEDKNVSVAFEDRKFTSNKYKIKIVDNGVGTTTFKLGTKVGTGASAVGSDGCVISIPNSSGGQFDSADINVTDVFVYGSTFSGFDSGFLLGPNQEFIGCTISNSGAILAGTGSGAYLYNTNVSNTTATSSLVWNTESETSGRLDGMNFTMGSVGSHAIELGPKTPTTISLNSITFNSYEGTGGSNLTPNSGLTGSAIYNNSGKDITINVSGGTTPSVRNGVGATTTILNSINVTLTGMKDDTEVRIYRTGTNPAVEIAGIETVTDGTTDDRSFTFSDEAGNSVDIVIISLTYENLRIENYIIPSTNSSLPIQQSIDRNYLNPVGP